jgi:putative hydrolase of the HAD superfamily
MISGMKIEPDIEWQDIDTVFLDMDGTLLDKYFDDYFWEEHIPEVYARKNNISILAAEEELLAKYKEEEGTLQWTDLDFWSDKLDLDIEKLKEEMNHMINVHPYVLEFLDYCHAIGKKIMLVTNAHPKTLKIKMNKTKLADYFDEIICADEMDSAKEQDEFWQKLQEKYPFDKERTLLVDDNDAVLESGERYGIKNLIHMSKSSSMLPVAHSKKYPSIIFFKELIVD